MLTVAIPVRDGAQTLSRVLAAILAQAALVEVEILVCDSGSRDGSAELCRRAGAEVFEIPPERFGHGRTRNLLVERARGDFVALITQDAEPAAPDWLARLVEGFSCGDDVALVYGPYRARPDAGPIVASELERWFRSLSPDGRPRLDRLEPFERTLPPAEVFGRRTFFTDANACVRRAAWQHVRFRDVSYAEDHALSLDMMRAGYAKVFQPAAPVLHSHDYPPLELMRRSFDEFRGLHEVYGWREPADPRRVLGQLRGELGAARRDGLSLPAVAVRHVLRTSAALAGSRADRIPAPVRRRLSLERRA